MDHVTQVPNPLLDSLEIMVESGRLCCTEDEPTTRDACAFSIKGSSIKDIYTLDDSKSSRQSVKNRFISLIRDFQSKEGNYENDLVLVHLRHSKSAWISDRFLKDLRESVSGLTRAENSLTPLVCIYSHSTRQESTERSRLIELRDGIFRWGSYSMAHQVNFMNLNGRNLKIEIT